jgi:hypothetical protein
MTGRPGGVASYRESRGYPSTISAAETD